MGPGPNYNFSKNSIVGACMRLLLGAKSMPLGCMSMERLGAKYAETFGCMYAEVGCKFHTAEGLPDSR